MRHFVEQFPGVADTRTFGVGFDDAVEEEGGWVGRQSEQVGFDLAGRNDGFVRGTVTEEVGVERIREGFSEGEENGCGFLNATCFQVVENSFYRFLGGGGGGGAGGTWVEELVHWRNTSERDTALVHSVCFLTHDTN